MTTQQSSVRLINQNFDPEFVVTVVQRARADFLATQEEEQQQRRHIWLHQRIMQLMQTSLSDAQIKQQLMYQGVPLGVAKDAMHHICATMHEQHKSASASGIAGATSPKSTIQLVLFGLAGLLLVAPGYGINTALNRGTPVQYVAAGTTSPASVPLPTFTPSLSSTSTPRPTATPTSPPLAIVQTDTLNVREGSDTQHEPPLTQVSASDELTVVGRAGAQDLKWIKVRLPDATEGWVSAEHVQLGVDLAQLPIAYVRPHSGIVEDTERLTGNVLLEINNDATTDSAVNCCTQQRRNFSCSLRARRRNLHD